jgi:hypothetical protein
VVHKIDDKRHKTASYLLVRLLDGSRRRDSGDGRGFDGGGRN